MPIKRKSNKQKLKRKNTWVDINDPIMCRKLLQKHYGSLFPTSSNPTNEKDPKKDKDAPITNKGIINQAIQKFFIQLKGKIIDKSKTPKKISLQSTESTSHKKTPPNEPRNSEQSKVATPGSSIELIQKHSTPKTLSGGSPTKKKETTGEMSMVDDSDEYNKVEFKMKEGSNNFDLLMLELMKDTMDFDKRKAVIKFNTKEAAMNFIKNKKLEGIVENKQLVEILPCEKSSSNTDTELYNAVEVDFKQRGLVGDKQSNVLAYLYLCVLMMIDEQLEVDKTTVVFTFNTKADAEEFLKKKKEGKLNDLVDTRSFVKTVPCENTNLILSQSNSSSSIAENRSKMDVPKDVCNKLEVDIVDKARNYQLLLSELMCDKIPNVYKGTAVITFKSQADAKNFIRKRPWKEVKDSKLVRTKSCENSDTQLKSSKGVSKRRKRKYRQIVDQMTKAQMQEYHKRIKQLDEIIKSSQQ